MIDYHSELQALVDACESFADPISGHRIPWQTALDRARAVLAEPEPEGPTDEELSKLLYYEFTTSTGHGERVDELGFARAVLARWGNTNTSRSI